MAARVWLPAPCLLLLLGLSGCPVTDDYYIESSRVMGESGSQGAGETTLASGGGSQAGSSGAASAAAGTNAGAGVGGSDLAQAGASEIPSGGAAACSATTERCNGHDDDCDELVDELACNSMMNGTIGCSGFVLPDSPSHGYMLCTGTKAHDGAQAACAAQNMRLAWLETAAENTAIAKKVAALSKDAEVLFGAGDAAQEGAWFWDAGVQFWQGNENGKPVGGLFSAWTVGTPNDENNDEDCAVLLSASATWGDRPCSAKYSYLCEEVAD
jgi:hypothetical protein